MLWKPRAFSAELAAGSVMPRTSGTAGEVTAGEADGEAGGDECASAAAEAEGRDGCGLPVPEASATAATAAAAMTTAPAAAAHASRRRLRRGGWPPISSPTPISS